MAEYFFEGEESQYINQDRLGKTLKFVPTRRNASVSAGELLNALSSAGIQPDEISGIYKVGALDYSYSVLFCYTDTAEQISDLQSLKVGDQIFDIMKLNEQIVNVRVHWLPLYYDNLILHEALHSFGDVVDVKMLKAAHANSVTFDGVREVRLRTDEMRKHTIPHVIHFNSGQTVLLTMQGRLPYCLKCKSVGHVRNKCPKNNRNYANAVNSTEEPAPTPVPTQTPAPAAPVAQSTESSDSAGGATEFHDGNNAVAKGSSEQEEESVFDETDGSLKRQRDQESDPDSDYIRPNRTAKSRPVAGSGPAGVSNSFNPIMSIGDILSEK